MTISYADSTFSMVLFRWKGSLYKAVLKELILFYILYYVVFTVQMCLLDDEQKIQMRYLTVWFQRGTEYIPLTFLLGFYVAGVVARWWEQFNWIQWPDKFMIVCNMTLAGKQNLQIRRTLARWSSLQGALAWRSLSERTFKRFPTEQHLVDFGLMTQHELDMYRSINAPYGKWFVPVMWMANLLKKCQQEGRIDSIQMKMLVKVLMSYRDGFAMLFVYDWVKIPLVYTQVVAIATYGYFGLCLIGRQPYLDQESREKGIAIMVPIFTTLQLIFYIGWLKVGQYLSNPFGEDDDDFELNWILDRNHHVAHMMADIFPEQLPKTDENFDESCRLLPYTMAAASKKDIPPKYPFSNFKLTEEEMELISAEDAFKRNHDRTSVVLGTTLHRMLRFHSLINSPEGRRESFLKRTRRNFKAQNGRSFEVDAIEEESSGVPL